MAHHASALKQMRHSEKCRVRNKSHRSGLKGVIKNFRQSIDEKDIDAARKDLASTLSQIDHKVSLGIIHKNTASRYKSRLTRAINKAAAAATK